MLVKVSEGSQEWWYKHVIQVLQREGEEDHNMYETSLNYIVSFRPAWTTS